MPSIKLNFVATYGKLRFSQAYRYLLSIGKGRALFFVLGVLAALAVASQHPSLQKAPHYWIIAQFLLLAGVHLSRNDKSFLAQFTFPLPLLFWVEYLVLSIPATALLAYQGQLLWILPIPVSALALALLPTPAKGRLKGKVFFQIGSAASFEWRVAWKLLFPPLLIYTLLGIGLSHFHFAFAPAAILLCGMSCLMVYQECEPLEMLEIFGKEPRHIFYRKAIFLLKEWSTVSAPLLFGLLIFHPPWESLLPLGIGLLAWVICLIVLLLSLIMKYASYKPHTSTSGNNLYLGLAFVSFLIPFLAPLPFLFLVRSYRKATKNLADWL